MTIIAQISDIHVCPHATLYHGVVDSNAMFQHAVAALNRLSPAPDLVLISGDLTEKGTPAEYDVFRRILADLRHPYVLMPGNHDQRDALRAAFPDQAYLPRQGALHFAVNVNEIALIALDSTVPGKHHGELNDETLHWLDVILSACEGRPAMIAMHHPPFVTGILYLDIYGLRDAAAFKAVLGQHPHVTCIVAGHVHRLMHTTLAGIPVITCPSTVTQIALRTESGATPASYLKPPAMMLHHWHAGAADAAGVCMAGGLVSHLSYIDEYTGPFPFA